MDDYGWVAIVGYICLALFAVILVVPGFVIGHSVSKKRMEERRKFEAEKQTLRENGGMIVPATIISARSAGIRNKQDILLDYEVDVYPNNALPFRAKFRDEVSRNGYTIHNYELMGEAGRKIWVLYDPNNMSRVYLDHYDEQHDTAMLNHRRAEFNKLTEGNESLKKTGMQAEAIIIRVDDLNLPYPAKGSRAMRLYFDVMPRGGQIFRAEANALIADLASEKYSAGKAVYVRFDPAQPERAVLDTERNKAIQT